MNVLLQSTKIFKLVFSDAFVKCHVSFTIILLDKCAINSDNSVWILCDYDLRVMFVQKCNRRLTFLESRVFVLKSILQCLAMFAPSLVSIQYWWSNIHGNWLCGIDAIDGTQFRLVLSVEGAGGSAISMIEYHVPSENRINSLKI